MLVLHAGGESGRTTHHAAACVTQDKLERYIVACAPGPAMPWTVLACQIDRVPTPSRVLALASCPMPAIRAVSRPVACFVPGAG